ncbi:GAF domain-containing protein [Spirillospora sp. NPDC047279]|uniref:GAF domain-containing protein n=1 Tax=Spirillospora sp. NPDC047279 TaxID=3155478 RepID=UPI0033D794C6
MERIPAAERELPPITWAPGGIPQTGRDLGRYAASSDLMSAVLHGAALPDLLTRVATHARTMAGASLAFIALPDREGNELWVAVAVGAGSEAVRDLTVRRGRSMIGRAFSTRRTLSARVAGDAALGGLPAGPILLVPLETGETVRGVLAVADRGEQPFTHPVARELIRFADLAARLVELAEAHR